MNDLLARQGCVDIVVDKIVSCLEKAKTGEVMDTVVFKIESRSYLRRFTEKNGWKINWYQIPDDVEVYALGLADTNEIQGLIGLRNDNTVDATYIHWACTAPHNNKHDFGEQTYLGVGGHLFAVAAEKSIDWGHGGYVYGFAANKELLIHYQNVFNAWHVGILHDFHFVIEASEAEKLLEVYNYGWRDGQILGR